MSSFMQKNSKGKHLELNIEKVRNELHNLKKKKKENLSDSLIVEKSKNLDRLLNKYYRKETIDYN